MNTDKKVKNRPALHLAEKAAGGTNVGGAVYGTVLVIGVLGAWNADETSGTMETLISLDATLLVFWIAHAYAHILTQGLAYSESALPQMREALIHDWPIMHAGIIPSLILAFGAFGTFSDRIGLAAALCASVLSLLGFGLILARAGGRTWLVSAVVALFMGCLGLLIAVLEIRLG